MIVACAAVDREAALGDGRAVEGERIARAERLMEEGVVAPLAVRVSPTRPVLPPSTRRKTGRTRSVFEIPASSAGTRPVRAT